MTGRQRIEIGRFLASVVALVAIVIAVPLVLARISSVRFGSPNPLAGARAPWRWSGSEIGDALGNPLSDHAVIDAVIRISVCVVWVAVVVVAITTAVEVAHMIRHRGLAMPSVRGVGWAQGIARYIAVGLLVVMPLVSAKPTLATTRLLIAAGTPAPASLVVAPSQWQRPPADIDQPVSAATSYTVQRGDSVFSIAAELAGHDDHRTMIVANEILDANLGTLMPDDQRFTNPAYIEPGWVLIVPSGATVTAASTVPAERTLHPQEPVADAVYVVESGDSLWKIADTELGSGTQWVEIWEENAGDEMGGGRTFDDPSLILPGWELDLPADGATGVESTGWAEVPTVDADATLAPADSSSSTAAEPSDGEDAPTAAGSIATAPGSSTWAASEGEVVATPPEPARPSTVAPEVAAPAPVTVAAVPIAEVLPSDSPGSTVATTTTTTALAGGSGEQPADTPPDRGVAPDAPSPIRFEHAAMLAAGILALVGIRRRQRLRSARPRSRVPEPRPEVVETELLLRRIDAGERAIRIDVACRAAAFELIDTDVQIVVVQVSTEGEIVLTLSGDADAPSPWVCVGSSWVLPAAVPIELLSEAARRVGMPCVAFVQLGVDDEGRDVLIDVEACGTLAIDAQPSQADAVVRALATGLATSPYAEVAHLVTVSMSDQVLLGHRNGHQAGSIDAAFDLAAALVGSTSTNGRTSFELRSLRTGGESWEPAVVLLSGADRAGDADAIPEHPRPGHGIAVVAAVGPHELPDAPARLVGQVDRWDLVVDGLTIPMTPVGLDRTDIEVVVAVLHDADRPLIWMDDVAADEHEVLSTVPDERDVDADDAPVAFEPMDHAIVVKLLGGVEVTDRAGIPGVFERSKTVELIAWLATHRTHSTRGAARTALWELDVRDATFANVVSEARRGLGRLVAPPDGEEWLARTLTDQLPLHRRVVTDAQLIEERLEQARLEPPLRAIDTLRPAVEMITGMPFADTSYLWPDAEGITSNLVLMAIGAAAELAGHALSIGDTELVFWSTGRGLAVLPGHEELIALRMRAHARSGDLAGVRQEWESYERVIIADPWSDGEPAPKLLALRRELLVNLTD